MQYTPMEIASEIFTYSKNKKEYLFIESQFKLRAMLYLMDLIWEEERGEYLLNERPKFRGNLLFPYYEEIDCFAICGANSIQWYPKEFIKDNRELSHDVIHFIWSICDLVWDVDKYDLMECINAYKSSKMTEINRNEGD